MMTLLKRPLLLTTLIIVAAISLLVVQLSRFTYDASLSSWFQGASGYQNALQQHKDSGKPMVVFFHVDWCASCKKLRQDILAIPEVSTFMKNYIKVKINPEKGFAEKAVADHYGVLGYPSFFVVPSYPNKINRIYRTSNISAQQFIQSCQKLSI